MYMYMYNVAWLGNKTVHVRSIHFPIDIIISWLCVDSLTAVPQLVADCVREGLVSLHGAVGVSQWSGMLPCLLLLHTQEEHCGATDDTRTHSWLQQVCSEQNNYLSHVHV